MQAKTGFSTGLSVLVTYLALPVLGWWLGGSTPWPLQANDVAASFLLEPARAGYLAAALCQAIAAGLLALRMPALDPAYPVRPGMIYWRNIALETVLLLAPFCDHRAMLVFSEASWVRWVGLLLYAVGASLGLWSSFLRTRALSQQKLTPYDPVLLVTGPFRRLRFPGYLGILLSSLGAALLFRSWVGLGADAFMLNFIIMRINEEDKAARLKYGIQWTAYSRSSWRLLPFIF
jgi:protein-S-isoprenylcysteine O-methyltransferase Ste14